MLGPGARAVLPEQGARLLARARERWRERCRVSWQLGSMALVLVALAGGFAWYERGRPLVEAGGAGRGAGRAGRGGPRRVRADPQRAGDDGRRAARPATRSEPGPASWSARSGALASNFFLGQGPWTPWQMLGWGGSGVGGGGAGAASPARQAARRWSLAVVCALAGFAFGAWMDLFTLMNFAAERSGDSYLAIATVSLPFNIAHAIGNALLCLAFGPAFVRMLRSLPQALLGRLAPGTERAALARCRAWRSTAAVLALVIAAVCWWRRRQTRRAAGPRRCATSPGHRIRTVASGALRASASSQLLTGWAAIGLEASGRNPLDARKRGKARSTSCDRRSERLRDRESWSARSSRCGAPASRRAASAGATWSPTCCAVSGADGSFDGYSRTGPCSVCSPFAPPGARRSRRRCGAR